MTTTSTSSLRARLPSAPAEFWEQLFAAYQTPPRYYHTIDHVAEVASHFDRVATDLAWQRPDEVLLAILFHDAIYRAGASDNERASADLARTCIERFLPSADIDRQRVAELIELTASHGRRDGPVDGDAALFLDCDMAILGAAPADYRRYAAAVAREFQPHIPEAMYRAGRQAFLARVLMSPRIFLSEYFHDRLDAAARANLAEELEQLKNRP